MKIFSASDVRGDESEHSQQRSSGVQITAIKAQVKSENRVSIFLDGKYSFSLTLDQLLEQGLKKNQELEESDVKRMKRLSDEGKLKQRTLEWVMGRPHSTREFRDYLYKKKADKELITAWVDEFTDKNYLNDESFARWFAENRRRKNKSNRAISSELFGKGVSSTIAASVIAELGNEESDHEGSVEGESSELTALRQLVEKLKDRPRYSADEQRFKRYLVSKGFRYDDIKKVLGEHS